MYPGKHARQKKVISWWFPGTLRDELISADYKTRPSPLMACMRVASHVQLSVLEIKGSISPSLLVKDAVTQDDHDCGSVEESQLAGEGGVLGTNLAQCPF
jgi:hypothetical protein